MQLKALWGGHTAALQFMLGRQLQVGERKHILQAALALNICAMWFPSAGPIFQQNDDESTAKMRPTHVPRPQAAISAQPCSQNVDFRATR